MVLPPLRDDRRRLVLMGAPRGWITDVPGITDSQASHAIGNGVVPHQGAAALRVLLGRISRWTEPA